MKALFLLLALLCSGCGLWANQGQRLVADRMAASVNASVEVLLSAYESEGDAAIDQASTAEAAERNLAGVRARWRPIWAAVAGFATAHDAWATTLERGGQVDAETLRVAYCRLRQISGPYANLPDHPLLSCGQ